MEKKKVLLITGCISPTEGVPFLKLGQENVRRDQYLESIEYYLRFTNIQKIVYCDNSDAEEDPDLVRLAKQCRKQFEWLSFSGDNKEVVQRGKGYGEGEIISFALEHSRLLQESTYFYKVTGRVKVRNFNLLLLMTSGKHSYFQINSADNLDTRFYGIPISTYRDVFLNAYKNVRDRDGVYLEHVFAEAANEHMLRWRLFPLVPNLQGFSGSTGEMYNRTFLQRLKIMKHMLVLKYL